MPVNNGVLPPESGGQTELPAIVTLNPDAEVVRRVREGLKARGGYCPCRREKTPETRCLCREFREQIQDPNFEGFCFCMLYYKSRGVSSPGAVGREPGEQ